MKKYLLGGLFVFLIPSISLADSVGGCGLGSKLFDGQRGTFPQVLAVTTNGTFGNQTFGISSGTSGCEQNGIVKSSWKTAAYIDSNMNKLAMDMSRGTGESLDSLASIIGISAADKGKFNSTLQANFERIFSSTSTSSAEVLASLKSVLAEDAILAGYVANI